MSLRQIFHAEPGFHAVLHDPSGEGVLFVPIICWAVVETVDGESGVTGMIAGDGDAWLDRADEVEDFIGYANPGEEVSRHWDNLAEDLRQEREIDETLVVDAKKREN